MPVQCRCRGSPPHSHHDEDRSWLPTVERGCCCSLETCCKVQGIIVVAITTMNTPMVLMAYFHLNQRPTNCKPTGDGMPTLDFFNGSDVMECLEDYILYGHAPHEQAIVAMVVLKILVQTVAFLSALVFLVGIKRRRPKLLLPYIRLLGVQIFFSMLAVLVRACLYNMWMEAIIVHLPVGVGIPYYMWVCAYSLYRKMKAEGPHSRAVRSTSNPTTAEAGAVPVRVYAPPPGFVMPPGYGFAPPGLAGPAATPALMLASSGAGLPPAPPYKPEDSPPPPYEEVVGLKSMEQVEHVEAVEAVEQVEAVEVAEAVEPSQPSQHSQASTPTPV